MLIKDVCKKCNLTKKAIEYYEAQGLVFPGILENGYRDFSQTDIEKLKKIAVLRKLDLSLGDIKNVLNNTSGNVLCEVLYKKELELERTKLKQSLLVKLSQGISWKEISKDIEVIDQKHTITQKLLNAFPGYYGRFISIHFAQFLNEPIKTQEQQVAFNTIIEFLDNVEGFSITADLQKFLEESTKNIGTETMCDMSANMVNAVQDVGTYIKENKEVLEQYITYKNSDEYKNSITCRLQNSIRNFNSTSGYYDIFIPTMKKLSLVYNEYYKMLESANETLILEYPEIEKWNSN